MVFGAPLPATYAPSNNNNIPTSTKSVFKYPLVVTSYINAKQITKPNMKLTMADISNATAPTLIDDLSSIDDFMLFKNPIII